MPTKIDPQAASETLSQSAETLRMALAAMAEDGETIDWPRIDSILAGPDAELSTLRDVLSSGQAALNQLFLAGQPVTRMVRDRSRLVDTIIRTAWNLTAATDLPDVALIAVGGYGRGELHPYSDVDLLILLPSESTKEARDPVAGFLAMCWDIGLEVGHSTRTAAQCRQECEQDISIITTLMEARLLTGPQALFAQMQAAVSPDSVWSSRKFFEGKLREQDIRHAQYDDTAYNLEPNVKGSPGGLRDIQTIIWVTQRHFGTASMKELVAHEFLTRGQYKLLKQGRELLWRIRYALHILTNRREDRLLFDYQAKIAALFGYQDASYMLAVEQLMQRYYRTVMDISRLNEMLLQLFREAILMNPDVEPEPLNDRFEVKNGYLQLTHDEVFEDNPSALLELFLLLQQYPDVNGVSAFTVTAIKRHLHLIDDEFRQDPRNHELFLQILRAPAGVTHELRRMNLYGVLGRYIPAFGRIVGRMQYDLFHAYTVDAHTLFVVSNLRRLALSRFDHEFSRCSSIMQALPTPEIAYIAGLFHDIAKGRGGDHSELGAMDAEAFCLEHGMSRYDARLVAWLVANHLVLSLTAQKKDISDPEVVREFATCVGDELHLDYLYVLTVSDVRATNPKLWNSWRAQLFEELYSITKQALRRGLANPIDKDELIDERRERARKLLAAADIDEAAIDGVWARLSDEYFLRCQPDEIYSHTLLMADPRNKGRNVLVDVQGDAATGKTAAFLFTPQQQYAFAEATAVFDELGLNIADARIISLRNDLSLSTYVVLEQSENLTSDPDRLEQIRRRLTQAVTHTPAERVTVARRAPRQVRMFSTNTLVRFSQDDANGRTVMELVASDRPGLLCEVGHVLRDRKIAIQTAKVLTIGERAEDVFFITDDAGHQLDDERCNELREALISELG